MRAATAFVEGYAQRNGLTLHRTRLAGDVVLILRRDPTDLYPEGQAIHIAVGNTESAAMTRLEEKARKAGL